MQTSSRQVGRKRGAGNTETAVPGGFFRELGKNFFSYGVVGAFSSLISFVTVPFFSRVFDPSEYGVLETVLLVILVLSPFGTLLLENSFLRFFFDSEEKSFRRAVFSTGFFTFIPLSLLLTTVLLLSSGFFSNLLFDSSRYSHLFFVAVIRLPFKNMLEYCSVVFRVEFNRKGYGAFHISHMALNVSLSIGAVVLMRWGLFGLLAVQTGVTVVFSLVALFFARRYLGWRYSPSLVKNMLGYSLPMLPTSMSLYVQRYVNRVFVLVLYSMYSMGIFSVASKIAVPLMIGAASLRMAWVPHAFKRWQEPGSREHFNRFLSLYLGIGTLLVVMLALFAREILLVVTTEVYLDAARLIGFIALAFTLQGASRLIGAGLGIKKKMGYFSVATVCGVAAGTLSMYLLAGAFELEGIAAGTLIGEIVGFAVLALLVKKVFPGYFKFLLPFSLVALCTVFLLLNLIWGNPGIPLKLLLTASYFALAGFIFLKSTGIKAGKI